MPRLSLLTLSWFLATCFLVPASHSAMNASQTLVLQTAGTERARITAQGVSVTGIISATYFEGNGSRLTDIPPATTTLTGNVTGSGTDNIVTTIANNAVTTARIADNAITAAKIATNAVTGNELASNAVETGHIVNGTILAADISTSAVTSAKIADSAVTLAKIQNISTNRLLGRASSGSGDVQQITVGSGLSFSGTTLSAEAALGCKTVNDSGSSVTCDSGYTMTGGGCRVIQGSVDSSYPSGNGWICSGGNAVVYARCCKL